MTVMTVAELQDFMKTEFPQASGDVVVDEVGEMTATVRVPFADRHLRPGGTMSGPSMMLLADTGLYIALLAQIGPVGLAVTTNLNINFLRKPAPADLIGKARILKLGKLLATGDVTIYSQGHDAPVAHATLTYAIPPRR
ncbi:PaaI family thioesterase [Futiania mangrovi]|uniref:PaaI family thioesterase n=1 Tax=Futiania mangrovi TaxID=2959716 RepID=A0A9J6P8K9_9PROT|nr:PaaI family thioesterase [Futiania mangrovii]MCP1336060.1 PaaI family thioesterase [Futiania mangrovii]